MKHKLKFFTCIIINSLFIIQLSSAQEKVKAIWNLSKNQEVITEGNIKASNQTLSNLMVAGYISSSSQRLLPLDSNWPKENIQNSERYTEYTVKAEKGDLKISSVGMYLSFNSSSAGRVNVSYSVDGKHFKPLQETIELVTGALPKEYKFENLEIKIPKDKTFYLRVYPWTTNVITSKYLVTKEVLIIGTL
ncbi:hypothetical protein A5893_16780 [Pedobacter psychrophilus]|uniref:F5/8 type C domain-containing protein n=1 Tax=Pedobacter psychrophilus TaxID=1826909 RepID=A0A179DAJ6_9SPHI|nr:hypothetical protein [Pedobacter psychrophilus]OAQ38018.1 hypothetical protein A5893_16780 [Pedobacter psychrophilus]